MKIGKKGNSSNDPCCAFVPDSNTYIPQDPFSTVNVPILYYQHHEAVDKKCESFALLEIIKTLAAINTIPCH